MPNLVGNITGQWMATRKLVDQGLIEIDKSMKISTSHVVKVDDDWAKLAKERPIIIINNQNINIKIINVLHELRRRMDAIDVAIYREAVLKGLETKRAPNNSGPSLFCEY